MICVIIGIKTSHDSFWVDDSYNLSTCYAGWLISDPRLISLARLNPGSYESRALESERENIIIKHKNAQKDYMKCSQTPHPHPGLTLLKQWHKLTLTSVATIIYCFSVFQTNNQVSLLRKQKNKHTYPQNPQGHRGGITLLGGLLRSLPVSPMVKWISACSV